MGFPNWRLRAIVGRINLNQSFGHIGRGTDSLRHQAFDNDCLVGVGKAELLAIGSGEVLPHGINISQIDLQRRIGAGIFQESTPRRVDTVDPLRPNLFAASLARPEGPVRELAGGLRSDLASIAFARLVRISARPMP